MPSERAGVIQLGGKDVTVVGDDVKVGDAAPEFTAHANDWTPVRVLESTVSKVRILAAVPSLSTSTCDKETRTFNERVADLSDDIRVIVVSTDLPPTQKNWCGAAGVERVTTVSDHMEAEFGIKYGVLIKERRYFRRATFVVGKDDTIKYVSYLPKLGDEPNYDEVIEAARRAL